MIDILTSFVFLSKKLLQAVPEVLTKSNIDERIDHSMRVGEGLNPELVVRNPVRKLRWQYKYYLLSIHQTSPDTRCRTQQWPWTTEGVTNRSQTWPSPPSGASTHSSWWLTWDGFYQSSLPGMLCSTTLIQWGCSRWPSSGQGPRTWRSSGRSRTSS